MLTSLITILAKGPPASNTLVKPLLNHSLYDSISLGIPFANASGNGSSSNNGFFKSFVIGVEWWTKQ